MGRRLSRGTGFPARPSIPAQDRFVSSPLVSDTAQTRIGTQ